MTNGNVLMSEVFSKKNLTLIQCDPDFISLSCMTPFNQENFNFVYQINYELRRWKRFTLKLPKKSLKMEHKLLLLPIKMVTCPIYEL